MTQTTQQSSVFAQAGTLRQALGNVFSLMDCKKALYSCDGDLHKAAEWLADGRWSTACLVSWNWEALHASTKLLSDETGACEADCLSMLKKCGGSIELARRKMAGLPALP